MEDIFIEKIDVILKKHLTQKSFDLWIGIRENISNKCWEKLTSSTGKYHQKENGHVPSVSEHTYEMVYAADKIIDMFEGIINKEVIFFSIILHDSYKYGLCKNNKHTEINHGSLIADIIKKNEKTFKQALSENDIFLLEKAVRYHDGRWSPELKDKKIDKDFFSMELLTLHLLDMLSCKNCLKIIEN